MNVCATASEIEILNFLQTHSGEATDIELLHLTSKAHLERALEGCITKGFVIKVGKTFALTEIGKAQI